jgi:hypothetical protein
MNKAMSNLIAYPATEEQLNAMKAFMLALNIRFEEYEAKPGSMKTQKSFVSGNRQAKTLRIDISAYHDEISDDFPLAEKIDEDFYEWCVDVDIETGVIRNWPQGQDRKLYVKVSDTGSYYLLDEYKDIIASIKGGYVPKGIIPPKNGYDKYIDIHIDGTGKIANWYEKPDYSEFRWHKNV